MLVKDLRLFEAIGIELGEFEKSNAIRTTLTKMMIVKRNFHA
jgi:hypothetical protein